jgi:hypothetical protein
MSLDRSGLLLKIEQAKERLRATLEAGCIAFANGGTGQKKGFVDDRFAGQGNARFAPLSYDYAKAKAGNASALRKAQKKAGRTVSRLIPVAYQSNTGTMVGIGSSKNLPILVRSGALRQAVSAGKARVVILPTGDRGRVYFANLPEYATYHDQGKGRLPVRRPVMPNAADRARMVAVMRKFLGAGLARAIGIG